MGVEKDTDELCIESGSQSCLTFLMFKAVLRSQIVRMKNGKTPKDFSLYLDSDVYLNPHHMIVE